LHVHNKNDMIAALLETSVVSTFIVIMMTAVQLHCYKNKRLSCIQVFLLRLWFSGKWCCMVWWTGIKVS